MYFTHTHKRKKRPKFIAQKYLYKNTKNLNQPIKSGNE